MTTSKTVPQSVSIKELKAHLSELVERVRQGDRILVTDRGEPVAELIPPSPERQALSQLAAAGRLHWSGGRPKGLHGIAVQGEPVADTVLRDRR